MSQMPSVLGLEPEEAQRRLETAGFPAAEIVFSGRRREGIPRVIRQKTTGGKYELVVSCFKELNMKPEERV
jgi:hypothetical protein